MISTRSFLKFVTTYAVGTVTLVTILAFALFFGTATEARQVKICRITSPSNGAKVDGIVSIVVATRPRVRHLRVYIDKKLLADIPATSSPIYFEWNTGAYARNHRCRIRAVAFGARGRWLGASSIAVKVISLPSPSPTATATPTSTPTPAPVSGTCSAPFAIAGTIYVDAKSGSDSNPGTAAAPFQTISAALGAAAKTAKSTCVLVDPGLYREALTLSGFGPTNPGLVIEGNGGQAVVTGADDWNTGWSASSGGTYTHAWPYSWGYASDPWGNAISSLGLRSEMVFVNGVQLTEQLSGPLTAAGTFYVVDGSTITIYPPAGTDMASADIEVALRPSLLTTPNGIANFAVENMTFEHAPTTVGNSTVWIDSASKLYLINDIVNYNNWTGLYITRSSNVAWQNIVADYNGETGASGWKVAGWSIDTLETSFNNWRGYAGGFTGIDAAGMKILRIHGATIGNYVSNNNLTDGFWADTDNANITLTNVDIENNLTHGLIFENSQGPIAVSGATVAYNGKDGVTGNASTYVSLEHSTVYGNDAAQLSPCSTGAISVTDYQSGQVYSLETSDWTMLNDDVGSTASGGWLWGNCFDSSSLWSTFTSTLQSNDNDWYEPNSPEPFAIPSGSVNLAGWQTATGQDAQSTTAAFPAP